MKIIKLSIFLLAVLTCSGKASATDFYVSKNGAGLKNGTSVQNSWAGFSSIKWGTGAGQLGPGSTLYICGTMNSNLNIGMSGQNGSPLVIRGDCPGNSGIIDGANIITGTWTLLSDNIYSVHLTTPVRGIITEDDTPLVEIPWKTNAASAISAMSNYGKGTWSYDLKNQILYVLTSSADNPSLHVMEASYGQVYSTQIYAHNMSYITIENLTIKNFGDYGIDFSGTGSNDTVNNCIIYDGYNWGVFSQGITNMVTSNNNIHHVVWGGHLPQQMAVGEGVRYFGNIGGSIWGNTISYVPSIGIDLVTITVGVKVYGNIIHDNIGLTNQWAGGVYTDNAQNNYIYNNLIYNWMVGINISSEKAGAASSGNYVYNNVIYNSYLAGFILGGSNYKYTTSINNFIYNNTIALAFGETMMIGTSINDTVENNIIFGNIQYFPSIYERLGKFDYNIYYSAFDQAIPPEYTNQTFLQWQKIVNGDVHSKQIFTSVNNIFVNPSVLNFKLEPGSKPIGAGSNLSSVFSTDFNGVKRPAVGAWDAGALQH